MNARRIVVACISLVLAAILRIHTVTNNDEQRPRLQRFLLSFSFFLRRPLLPAKELCTGCQSASLKYSHNYPRQLITGGVTINY